MDDLNYREILVRKPFYEVQPRGYMQHGTTFKDMRGDAVAPEDFLYKKIKTQADFLREYYPSAHQIFNPEVFPDVLKEDPDTGERRIQPVTRIGFAFQQVIATKHTLHLTGNDVQFELADGGNDVSEEEHLQDTLTQFRKGWLLADMEVRHFEAVRSYMIVAEAAVVGYFDKGKFKARTLSYANGDMLFPHFDSLTGELTVFARRYYDYDEDGTERIEWVEVWDDEYLYRYKRGLKGVGNFGPIMKIKEIFGINAYELVSKQKHGFNFIPVAYVRNDDGPCWSTVQHNIEDYEEAFSYLCESNKAYAFPIFYTKGDGDEVSLVGDMNGAVKAISMAGKDNDAGFLNGTDASSAFATQLNKAYELIYELSFTVKPPELKSGDLPGVAVKLLYSPAVEVAMNDAQNMQPFLDKLVRIAKYGIGYQENMTATMVALPVNAWVEPYIHQNDTELFTNLATAVQNNFLSTQTASERISKYAKNDEFERIQREKKEEQQQDLLVELEKQDNQTQNSIEQQEAQARINRMQGGNDVNTGGNSGKRGRPNKSGKDWDENGNNPIDDANNWDRYDKTH